MSVHERKLTPASLETENLHHWRNVLIHITLCIPEVDKDSQY
jgi:hypothetical protein